MDVLLSALRGLPEYEKLLTAVAANRAAAVSGTGQVARGHWIAALYRHSDRPMVVVCQDDEAARRVQEELRAFLGEKAPILPTRELTLYDTAAVSRGWEQKRLKQLYDLAMGKTRLQIASLEALTLRTMPKATLCGASMTLRPGMNLEPEELARRLEQAGYARTSLVEGPGQYALRGGIVDVFSPACENPLRVEFFGDEVDIMGFFDVLTQRRTENADDAPILPVAEAQPHLHPGGLSGLCDDLRAMIARQKRRKTVNTALVETLQGDLDRLENGVSLAAADRYLSLLYPDNSCGADYISKDALVIFCDHSNLQRAARLRQEQLGMELDGMLQSGLVAGELCDYVTEYEDVFDRFREQPVVFLDNFLATSYPKNCPPQELLSVTAKQLPPYGSSLDTVAQDLRYYQNIGYGVLVLTGNRRRGEILQELLQGQDIKASLYYPAESLPKAHQIFLTDGALPAGIEYPELQLAILTEGQLLVQKAEKRKAAAAPEQKKKKATNRQKLNSFTDLHPGDLVVHEHHGIGRYVGIEQIKVDGALKDYVKIAYQGTDALYVPATQLDMVSKYIGGGEDTPVKLNKLGGEQWQKTKAKARTAAKKLAVDLIKLYAQRQRRMGYAFSADTPWQTEFEDAFPYAETEDQLRCVAEIKGDMESPQPMDRLLCGDVGFGKTEVALRAAMKCMLDGKQVAVLVPTTVLARQHYVTAKKRFSGFPVNIDVLSRFRTAQQQKDTLSRTAAGQVDMLIGTHKLLQKNVSFKDLGLLIVDEEQRFGVSHKERLKELCGNVDVLTLSATPIPRTLNMALSGIRDMSTIEEPPRNRYPVQTFVLEHNEAVIHEAIRRELERGGQVFYLHNRVESIDRCAADLQKAFPDARVAVAHGKMNQEQLGDVMQQMDEGEIQILVCTTIIETGIDISNVNTLIIENADRFGLSQLHQLRGRVGRSNRHAFCYLTFRRGKVLSEVADKRLSAIRDFAAFGSGFKIAMRDLEIRGAGDLLGAEQSGHLMSVGYDMYLKLLEEAVLEERGEPTPREAECSCDISVTANIDKDYVPAGEQRMDLYRRMAAIRTQEDADELLDEIVDRFGDPPKGVMNLVDIALLRARAAAVGVIDISQKDGRVNFTLSSLDFSAVSAICAEPSFHNKLFFSAGSIPLLTWKLSKTDDPLRVAQNFVAKYAGFCSNGNVL